MQTDIIVDLHSRVKPHAGQIKVIQPLFYEKGVDTIFAQCGRKFGKTWTYLYAVARLAMTKPESEIYIVGPSADHIKTIMWHNRRLHKIVGWKNIKRSVGGSSSSTCLLETMNGSLIICMGSENFEAANGLSPDLVVYDEFKAFQPNFHETMDPNRAAKGATLMIVGTPPQLDARNRTEYLQLAQEAREDEKSHFFRMTSYENPHIDHVALDKKKAILFKRGEEHVWYREYEGRIVNTGKNMIFGMLDKEKHVHRYLDLLDTIRQDQNKMQYFAVHDPGTTSCHAVLIGCINPYNKNIYLMDEIYETNQANTSVRKIMPRVKSKALSIYNTSSFDKDWIKVYDEAESWFRVEVFNQYKYAYRPTQKKRNKKEDGLSLIKDTLIYNKLHISDKCTNLFTEMEQYCTDDNGRLPSKYDHLIDCLRYLLGAAAYKFEEVEIETKVKKNEFKEKRGVSLEQDIREEEESLNPWFSFEEEFFNDDFDF